MARIRAIHPRAPQDEDVASMSIWARHLWDRLPCYADREGRLEDRPLMLKGEVFPADDVNVNDLLEQFEKRGFVIRYTASNGRRQVQIVSFHDYQRPDRKERNSVLEPPTGWTEDKHGKWMYDKTLCQGAGNRVESGTDLVPNGAYPPLVRPRDCSGNPVSGIPVEESLSSRDPSAGTTDPRKTSLPDGTVVAPKLPGGYEWLCRFQIAHRDKFGRDYGHGEQDARATSKLSELLESMPAEERSADWERRRELFAEFLGRTDARTQSAGWSFAFFVQDFRALAIPVAKRPKITLGRSPTTSIRQPKLERL